MIAVIVLALPAGCSGPCSASGAGGDDLYGTSHFQPLPGDVDLANLSGGLLWTSPHTNITTRLVVEDIDDDGSPELLFGTDHGRVKAMDVGRRTGFWESRPTRSMIHDIAVGDLDADGRKEIVVSSADGLRCLDALDGSTEWSQDLDMVDSEVHLVPRDGDLEKKGSEVLLLQVCGDYYYGTSLILSRYNWRGAVTFSTQLAESGELGPAASCLVADLDGDGWMEAIVADRGATYQGFGGVGRHLWRVNATSGDVMDYLKFDALIFMSRPALLPFNGSVRVAIGLFERTGEYNSELLIHDFRNGTSQLLDMWPAHGNAVWTELSYLAAKDLLVMSTNEMDILVWSLEEGRILWNHTPTGNPLVTHPLTLCDIDSNGEVELLLLAGGTWVIDLSNGTFEAQVRQAHGRAKNIHAVVDDLDGDGRSEMVFGYYDDIDTQTYELRLIGDVGRVAGDESGRIALDVPEWATPTVLALVFLGLLLVAMRRK